MTIRKIIKCFVPYGFIKLIPVLRKWNGTRCRKKSYGKENKDKTFYLIIKRNGKSGQGLLRAMNRALSHIAYAVENGWIPVVDWQNSKYEFLEDDMLHKENAWEYFFEQPGGYTLQDIAKSKNIILSGKTGSRTEYKLDDDIYEKKEYLQKMRTIFRQNIRFNKSTQKYLEDDYTVILKNKGDVLGVICRGTDYTLKRPSNHPIQPDPIVVIKKAKDIMSENDVHYLYLATEDQEIYELFLEEFGEKLLVNKQDRFAQKELDGVEKLVQIHHNRDRDKYWLNLEYLSSINLLSKCKYFIGGRVGGTIGVFLMTDGFDYEYIWDLGQWA